MDAMGWSSRGVRAAWTDARSAVGGYRMAGMGAMTTADATAAMGGCRTAEKAAAPDATLTAGAMMMTDATTMIAKLKADGMTARRKMTATPTMTNATMTTG